MQNLTNQCRALYDSVRGHLDAGRLREAALTCKQLCETYPQFASGWLIGSVVAEQLGNFAKALEYAECALALEAENPGFQLRRAQTLVGLQRLDEARAQAAVVVAQQPQHPDLLAALGLFYMVIGAHAEARQCYQQSLRRNPGDANSWFNLASIQRFLGALQESERAYDEALRLNPANFEAYYLRAGLRKQSAAGNHIEAMEAVLRQAPASWKGTVQLCYALAKEYEDIAAPEQSFAYLKRGADLYRANMQYDVAEDVRTIDTIIESYSAHFLQDIRATDVDEPIFIIGLPRTGTTLVDRILSSHSGVFSAGELNNFAIEMMKLVQGEGTSVTSKAAAIGASLQLDFARLGANYLRSTRPQTGHTARFIDKMPLNYLYCGLIAKALPGAKIIELVRHPLDTCYAMYKQLFTLAYPFSYDLGDLAEYYLAYTRMMKHWHAVLPGRIARVHYENLVDNQEAETRRLLQFCELDWEAACLAFEKNPQASTTASAAQVREPIYRSSMGKWTAVRQQLLPLVQRLRERADELPADFLD